MFKRSLLSRSIAASIALAGLPMLAQAQDTQDEPLLEEVVVTGIRASLNQAIDIKRESMDVMDSIVAEDIGKLPDNNVVESLQRVAGVQVTDRAGGETNVVSIRGLTDVSTTVNGRTIFTASGRAVALADIPSTLVSRVDVIKNRSAETYENGIAGQIDVHTFRPFDFDGSRVSVSARGIYLEEAEAVNPTISALFSDRWDTGAGEFGALVNLSYSETEYRDQSTTPGAQVPFIAQGRDLPDDPNILDGNGNVVDQRYVDLQRIFPTRPGVQENPIWTAGLENGLPTAQGSTLDINGDPAEYYISRDAMFMSDFTGERERPAANVSLQFAPNDRSEYTFEAFYNGYRNEGFNSLNFAFVDWWGSLGGLSDDVTDTFELYEGTNVIKERTIRDGFTFGSGDYSTGKTDSYVYALGGDWELTDKLNLKSELVYQDSEFESSFIAMRSTNVRYETYANFSDKPSIEFRDNPATPDVDEGDQSDISQYAMAEMYDSGTRNEGSAVTFTADAEYFTDGAFFKKIDFGIRHDVRDATEFSRTQDAAPCDVVNTTGDAANCQFSTYEGDGIAHINSGFMDALNVPRTWAVVDGPYLKANRDYFTGLYGLDANDPLLEEFAIEETNTALYVDAEFETEIAGKRLDGQVGVRYVDVTTDTVFTDQVDLSQTEGSTDNQELLSFLSLRYNLTDELIARFNYGETLRMPAFGDLNPTITYFDDITNIGYGTATGGNADLQPTTSQNYDLSLEWYFGDASNAYVTLFQRDIEGLVVGFRNRVNRQIEGYDTDTFILSQPDNASDGELSGVEVGFNYFPENLEGYWDGLGVQSSFTFLDSEQVNPVTNSAGEVTAYEKGPMFGVSDTSYSVAVAYERDTFDARLAYVWREDFLNNNEAALFANPLGVYRDAQSSLDFQFSYNVSDELIVTFDATNLTEEVYQSRYGNSYLHTFGNWQISRTFALGARYSF
ncbi:TonB-dependent receptor [Marinimicrobium sp. C6131]|uniref:TonB-dependent receptor n=1 Tax=Marinimicrobium sp. C6131 TaxID=3022676 RepID=UPI00223D9FB0|nr:TonB-dependent receptor [Marinimicrobium sp. C6131]UZJ44494.1 TonB-dependent receptor [Marinimicrobium sp. C6131]